MKHQKLNDPLTEHLGRVQNEQNKPSKEEILAKVKSWVKDGIRSAEVRSRLSSDVYQMSDPEIDRLLAEVGNKNETEDKKENAKVSQKFKKGDRVKMIDDTEGLGIGIIQYYEGIEDEGSPVQHIKWSKGEPSSERESVLKKV